MNRIKRLGCFLAISLPLQFAATGKILTKTEVNTETNANQTATMKTAVAEDKTCRVSLTGNDRMRYNLPSFIVEKQCHTFTLHFENIGRLPKASMGHNVVIAKKTEAQALATDGMSAGMKNEYLPPEDTRIIVKTPMIGGGEKTSVSFSTDLLEKGGDYVFFCSFPGHYFLMQGQVIVE